MDSGQRVEESKSIKNEGERKKKATATETTYSPQRYAIIEAIGSSTHIESSADIEVSSVLPALLPALLPGGLTWRSYLEVPGTCTCTCTCIIRDDVGLESGASVGGR